MQYGQLGAYRYPSCGWSRPALLRRVTDVELTCNGYGFDLTFGPEAKAPATHITTRYNGLYMVYNVAAAFFAAHELGVDSAHLQPRSMPTSPPADAWAAGRSPAVPSRQTLAKNPVGFDRRIQSIKTAGGRLCAFFLNDNDADGHDVSWIYDVDFEAHR